MKRTALIYSFIIIYILSYITPLAQAQEAVTSLTKMVSENHGTIRDSYFAGNSQGIVIHIQDLHCNFDAQMSTYRIIDELIEKYGLKLVTVEGSVGRLETAPFSLYPDESVKEKVGKFLVKSGRYNGAAYAHVMRKGEFTFWGADDRGLYKDNVEAYKDSIGTKGAHNKYYENIKSILNAFKDKVYSAQLKELDKNIQSYKKEDMGFAEYVDYINGLSVEKSIDDKAFPNFTKLVDVLGKEADIDFLEVDNQRAAYIDKLSSKLEKNRLSELLDKSLYFKTAKISALEFYAYLKEVSEQEDTPAMSEEHQQLAKYIEYIRLYNEIENITLFKEIDGIEEALKDKLFTDDIQRKVDKLSRTIDVLNDLFSLKLTKDTLQYYRDNRRLFSTAYIINFITENAPKHNVTYNLDPAFRKIDAELPTLERFYKLAEERDSVLVYNTLNKMNQEQQQIAVLVSGGFHTDGITKLLKDKNISYIVVTPKVERLQKDNPYASILLGEKDLLDRFYDELMEHKPKK